MNSNQNFCGYCSKRNLNKDEGKWVGNKFICNECYSNQLDEAEREAMKWENLPEEEKENQNPHLYLQAHFE